MEITLKDKKQAWLHAFRLRTLPLALSSIFLASIIATKDHIHRWEVTLLASLTTVLLQILSNLANDYGDTIHGADSSDREGPIRAVQSGMISPKEMKNAMVLFGILSLASGLSLLYFALQDIWLFLVFLGIGFAAIFAAVNYTSGSKPYGYMGLGDVSVFLFFGITGVVGTYFLHGMGFKPSILLPATSLGLFSTAVLNINNVRDIESDRKAGKKSIPVRVGRTAAVRYNWCLILGGNLSMLLYMVLEGDFSGLTFVFIIPLMLHVAKGVSKAESAGETDPFLKKMAIGTLLWVLAFGIGTYIF